MNFTTGYILTKAGEALQAKAESGTELKLTKMQLGSGTTVSVDDYYERTALIEPKNAMSISEIKQVTTEKNLCVAIAVLTNAAVDTSYTASELGLFAQDTDGTEILYAVSYDSNPTYIASKDDGTDITMKFYMYIVSTSDINITLTLPKTAEEIATVAAGYAAKAAESEAKAKQLEATANDYLQTTQQAMTLANEYANISKAWAEGNASPDGVVDTNSPTGYTQSAKVWAEEAKGYRDIAIAGQMQADWNEENTESKAFIKGKPELNFIPQSYTNFTDYSKMSIISRESHLENVPPSTYAHINSIKECLAKGKVDLSSYTHHTVIDDVRLYGEEASLYINKESGWSGSNKFNHIFSYTAKYPFTLYGNNVTDTFLTESTFETFRQGVRTNAPLTIQRCYFGDNGNFDVDSANPDCAILAKSKADIKVYNSTVSISCRKGLDSTCIIKFDSTENEPATVYLKDCELVVSNQNLEDRNGGAIADLSNKNDRLIIDNCTFYVRNRINYNHSVMPYMLKPFKTVWSYNPFKSYVIGGKMLDITSFTPTFENTPKDLYPTIVETENSLKNPFGGNLLKVQYDFYLTYHVPKELVGTVMYAHIYIYDYKGNNPTFSYLSSDGTGINGEQYKWFSKGRGELSKRTPYINVFPFIPTKEKGKFTFHNSGDGYLILAGAALVQDINKNKLCDYEEAYQE